MVLVLLVDDDNAVLSANADALLAGGHQVCTAVNGEEALEELSWNCPDVLVCDSNMPIVDGWDLLRQVRGDDRYAGLRIVFMGSADDKELRLAAFRNGVDEYLPKPFLPEELVRRIDRALARSSILGREPVAAPDYGLRGRLDHLALSSVLALLEAESKSGILQVQHAGSSVHLTLQHGRVTDARLAREAHRSFEECVELALSWTSGEFRFAEQTAETAPDSRVGDRGLPARGTTRGRHIRRA